MAAAQGSSGDTARFHVGALTGLRAYAALAVVAFHAWFIAGSPLVAPALGSIALPLSAWAEYGWVGVDVFFVLSGFLLTAVELNRRAALSTDGVSAVAGFPEPYGVYLRRRVLRVFPAYYASLTFLLAMAPLGFYIPVPAEADMFLHLAMAHNVVERYIVSMNGVFWTLPFEWSFYLLFPWLFVFLRRHGPLVTYGLAVALALAMKLLVVATDNGYPQLFVFIRLDEFVVGMAFAAACARRPPSASLAQAAFWVGAAGLLLMPYVFPSQRGVVHYYDAMGFVRPYWIQLSIAFIVVSLTCPTCWTTRLFDNRVAIGLGTISYSIYLWHNPVLELLRHAGAFSDLDVSPRGYAEVLLRAGVVLVAVSALSWYAVERTFQRGVGVMRTHPIRILLAWAAVLLTATVVLNGVR